MQFLGFLAVIFGPIMEWIYRFIPNYGWALIVFTLLVNLVFASAAHQAAEEHCAHVGFPAKNAGDPEKSTPRIRPASRKS